MKRGELYRVFKPTKREPKKFRVFAIVSRQEVIETNYSTVICAPVYTTCLGLTTEVEVGVEEGLKHHSCIRCDELYSLPKSTLTDFIGTLSANKVKELNEALRVALNAEC